MGPEKPSPGRLVLYLAFPALYLPLQDYSSTKGKIGAAILIVWALVLIAVWVRQHRNWRRDPAPYRPIRYEQPPPRV